MPDSPLAEKKGSLNSRVGEMNVTGQLNPVSESLVDIPIMHGILKSILVTNSDHHFDGVGDTKRKVSPQGKTAQRNRKGRKANLLSTQNHEFFMGVLLAREI